MFWPDDAIPVVLNADWPPEKPNSLTHEKKKKIAVD